MRVRFWGTRGSLPVAPRGEDVRQKIKQALLQANGRQFDSEAAIERSSMRSWIFPSGIVMAVTLRAWKSLMAKTTRFAIWVPACAV